MEREAAIIVDYGVSRVGSALKAYDDVRLLGKHIRDLALAFITPVGSYNSSYHFVTPPDYRSDIKDIIPYCIFMIFMPAKCTRRLQALSTRFRPVYKDLRAQNNTD